MRTKAETKRATVEQREGQIKIAGKLEEFKLLQYVHRLLALLTVNLDGSHSMPLSSAQWNLPLQVLSAHVSISGFPDRTGVKSFVTRSLVSLRRQATIQPKLAEFRQALEQAVTDHLAKPAQRFRIIFPLNVAGEWVTTMRPVLLSIS